MLVLVQLFHLAVTLYMFICLFYITYCHVYGKRTRLWRSPICRCWPEFTSSGRAQSARRAG